MPTTPRGNKWILVLTDHFTRWQDAIALPDATAPVVATALDDQVFCYFGLPEQIHTDQGAQFESQLMKELCQLWHVDKTHTTLYHPQANGMVERGNRGLGDALRALLLRRAQEEWDRLLPQIMRAFRGTPHSTTGDSQSLDAGKGVDTARPAVHLPASNGTAVPARICASYTEQIERGTSNLARRANTDTTGRPGRATSIYRGGSSLVGKQTEKERRESQVTAEICGAVRGDLSLQQPHVWDRKIWANITPKRMQVEII